MNNWFEANGCKIIKAKYRFFYIVKEYRYSPYQQLLYEVEFIDSNGNSNNEIFIVGNWFWGLMKDDVWCSWNP